MMAVRSYSELSPEERAALYAFTAERDPERFLDQEAMERAYASSAFEHGSSQFSCWEGDRLHGAMGAVVRDVDVRGEAFVTAVAVDPGREASFDALLDACLGCLPRRDGVTVRMGVPPQHAHLEGMVTRRGFALEYDGLVMARAAAPLAQPGGDRWRIEVVSEANCAHYRRVLDEAFRHSPNGATITMEQIQELMSEVSHADLLGLAYLDGAPAAAYELCLQEDVGWIETVGVDCALQGRGLGRWIVASAVEKLCEHGVGTIKLLVMSSNVPAVRLYRGCGFEVESVMSRWWRLTG